MQKDIKKVVIKKFRIEKYLMWEKNKKKRKVLMLKKYLL